MHEHGIKTTPVFLPVDTLHLFLGQDFLHPYKEKVDLSGSFLVFAKNVFSINVSLLLLHIYAKFLFQDANCGQSILHSKNIFVLVWCRIFVAKVCFFIISDFHNFGVLANIQIIWSHSEEAGKRGKERELQ